MDDVIAVVVIRDVAQPRRPSERRLVMVKNDVRRTALDVQRNGVGVVRKGRERESPRNLADARDTQ